MLEVVLVLFSKESRCFGDLKKAKSPLPFIPCHRLDLDDLVDIYLPSNVNHIPRIVRLHPL